MDTKDLKIAVAGTGYVGLSKGGLLGYTESYNSAIETVSRALLLFFDG